MEWAQLARGRRAGVVVELAGVAFSALRATGWSKRAGGARFALGRVRANVVASRRTHLANKCAVTDQKVPASALLLGSAVLRRSKEEDSDYYIRDTTAAGPVVYRFLAGHPHHAGSAYMYQQSRNQIRRSLHGVWPTTRVAPRTSV